MTREAPETREAPARGGRLRVVVLGSAAGGGSPQWNCRCEVCVAVRAGRRGAPVRTQSSLAVSADGKRWALLEASPDLLEQVRRERRLWPRGAARSSPIGAVVLSDGDVDHVAGLLSLRERHAFGLYGTRSVLALLDQSPIFRSLDPTLVARRALPLEERVELRDGVGAPLGIFVRAFSVPGKVPLWAEGPESPDTSELGEHVVGLEVGAGSAGGTGGASFFFVPSCAAMTSELAARLTGAHLVLFDGTVWDDTELESRGVGEKSGRRMGHMAMSGPRGSLASFAPLGVGRKVFVHLNNTNPVLLPDSDERRRVTAEGWEVAHDGMELEVPS